MKLNGMMVLLLLVTLRVEAGFQYAVPLMLDETASGYRFNVPAPVYQGAHHADLRDLRITNQAGDEVPQRLTLNEDLKQTSWSNISLPVFTLRRLQQVPVTSQQTRTTWQGDEEHFTVTTSEEVRRFVRQQVADDQHTLLIDASVVKGQGLRELALNWTFQTVANRVFYVDLQGSDDLSVWHPVLNRQKLIELDTGGRVVLENRLPLGRADHLYYKLVFTGPEVPEINQVTVRVSREQRNSTLRWRQVASIKTVVQATAGHVIEWDTGGHFPVEAVRLHFDYPNLMATVRLFSRSTADARWRLVSSGDVYDVGAGELSMLNDGLSFGTNQHRHWRLTSDSTINQQWVEGIEFAWRSHQLQFLAQGEAPFTLNYGDPDVNSWPSVKWYQTLTEPMKRQLFSAAIRPGETQTLKAPVKAEPVPTQSVNHSRLVFWVLLVVVLGFLLVMAVRLLREVGDDE
jgi:hypothetical protein